MVQHTSSHKKTIYIRAERNGGHYCIKPHFITHMLGSKLHNWNFWKIHNIAKIHEQVTKLQTLTGNLKEIKSINTKLFVLFTFSVCAIVLAIQFKRKKAPLLHKRDVITACYNVSGN